MMGEAEAMAELGLAPGFSRKELQVPVVGHTLVRLPPQNMHAARCVTKSSKRKSTRFGCVRVLT